jgi:hypothetical protein
LDPNGNRAIMTHDTLKGADLEGSYRTMEDYQAISATKLQKAFTTFAASRRLELASTPSTTTTATDVAAGASLSKATISSSGTAVAASISRPQNPASLTPIHDPNDPWFEPMGDDDYELPTTSAPQSTS